MIDVIGLIEYNVYRSSKKKRKADKKLENYQISGTRNRHEKRGEKWKGGGKYNEKNCLTSKNVAKYNSQTQLLASSRSQFLLPQERSSKTTLATRQTIILSTMYLL